MLTKKELKIAKGEHPKETRQVVMPGCPKGGLGKTTLTRSLLAYCDAYKIPHTLVESDRVNPDAAEFYGDTRPLRYAIFSENLQARCKGDPLFKASLEKPYTICNLAAQYQTPLLAWYEEGGLYELCQEYDVQFNLLSLTDGGHYSTALFLESLELLGAYMNHYLVRNWGLCDDFSHLDDDKELQAAITRHQIPIIDFPRIPYAERNFIEKHRLTFAQALEHPDLNIVSKQRIRKFLRAAFTQFDRMGVFSHDG